MRNSVTYRMPAILLAALLICPALVAARSAELPLNNCWSDQFGLPAGTSSSIHAAVMYRGDLVIAGTFTAAGSTSVNRVARWDGHQWQPMGMAFTGTVFSLTVYRGDLIAGGSHLLPGGGGLTNVARWNGEAWSPLGILPDWHYAIPVESFIVHQGKLYAWGTYAGFEPPWPSRLAVWNGREWTLLISGLEARIDALVSYRGELIASGVLPNEEGELLSGILRREGDAWVHFDSVMRFASALTVHRGSLYSGGSNEPTGLYAQSIARWTGSGWEDVASGLFGSVDVLVSDGHTLYAGGGLQRAGEQPIRHIMAWDGQHWDDMDGGVSGPVLDLLPLKGAAVAVGNFQTAGRIQAQHVARWDGHRWHAFVTPGAGLDGTVRAVVAHGGVIYAAGEFIYAGSQRVNHVAAWDGAAWHALGSGLDQSVYALAVYDGHLIAGGAFTKAGDVTVNCIAAWDGQNWYALGTGVGGWPLPRVTCMTVYNDELMAGGTFDSAGGVETTPIAAWNGSSWRSLGTGVNSAYGGERVNALAVYDGRLIAGGSFERAGGIAVQNIAAWNGSSWALLVLGLQSVTALLSFDDQLAIGHNNWPNYCIRYDGLGLRPMGAGLDGQVYDFCLLNGRVIAGGWFGRSGNTPVGHIALWNGENWEPHPAQTNGPVHALLGADGLLAAGGLFTQCGDQVSARFGLFDLGCPKTARGRPWTATAAGSDVDSGIMDLDVRVFPNPFNARVRLSYTLERSEDVVVEIFDVLGRHVRTLWRGYQAAGSQWLDWNGLNAAGAEVASGMYFYRVRSDRVTQSGKLMLIR